jgi:hypothetical protein
MLSCSTLAMLPIDGVESLLLVLIGTHDGERAGRLVGVGGIFGAAFHARRVVINLEERADARQLEAAKVVVTVWVVVRGELVEVTNTLKDLCEVLFRQRRGRHDHPAAHGGWPTSVEARR